MYDFMHKLNGILSDHKLLFPMIEIASFYIFPYTIGLLVSTHPPLLSFPTDWMWGLCFFAIASYSIGIIAYNHWLGFSFKKQDQRKLSLLLVIVLYILLLRLLSLFSFPLLISVVAAFLIVVLIHFTVSTSFSDKHSVIMTVSSLTIVLVNFIYIGGVPLLNQTLLIPSKLSVIREVALPLFLLGATSISLRSRRTQIKSYIVQFLLFGIGGFVFLLNGKRLDVLTILLCYGILLLRRQNVKVSIAIIVVFLFSVLGVTIFMPSYTNLFRQEFNFQVLRHIMYYVEDPLFGTTHGAISFGLRQDFLGSTLIYGPDDKWTLTATWLGPAYLDFGLLGVFFTMSIVAVVLEHLYSVSKNSLKSGVIYIVTLSMLISLFEEGADLFTIIFIVTMLYASTFQTSLTKKSAKETKVLNLGFKTRKTKLALILVIIGMLTITYSFMAEYSLSKSLVEQELVGNQTTFLTSMEVKYYHAKLVTTKTADYVEGKLQILDSNDTLQEFTFNGLFWEAVRDRINVAWFKPTVKGDYTLRLLIDKPDVLKGTFIIIESSPLSNLIPNYFLVYFGIFILLLSCIIALYELLTSS